MHVELQLIFLNITVELDRSLNDLASHLLQPGHVLLLQVSQTPEIAAVHERQEMETSQRLAIPIEIRGQEETLILGLA